MIPQGMALQKSLTEKEEQMLFTGAGPKTKPKIVGEPNRKKREKKGSNNLATFGIRTTKTLEEVGKLKEKEEKK